MRRMYDAGLKAKVALEAIKGEKTIAEISSKYGIHTTQIGKWKKDVLERMPEIFNGKMKKADRDMDWYSRYVIGWELSNTIDIHFCLDTLENALLKSKPEILNSDQASQ